MRIAAPPTAERLDELVSINTELAKATEAADMQSIDSAWHEELVGGCTNQTLQEILAGLRWRIRRYETAYMQHGRPSPQSAVQHHAMVLALRRGDLDRAAQLLELNWKEEMQLVAAWLRASVSDSPGESRA